MKARAVFLDRDGTIIEDTGYVDDPKKVRLLPGAADAIARLNRAGWLVVIVSNQSGVARGLFDEEALSVVHQRMETLLRERGATIDGAYYCPYLDGPDATVKAYRRDSTLRKPKPGMLHQAAEELDIDLEESWMIGDSKSDVQAGDSAGCRTIRLDTAHDDDADHTAVDLSQAAKIIERDGNAAADHAGAATAQSEPHAEPGTTSQARRARGGTAGSAAGELRAATSEPGVRAAGGSPAMRRTSTAPPATRSSEPQASRHRLSGTDADVLAALERIREELERANRPQRQHDFSMVRLFGSLLQMLALVAAVLGVMAMIDDENAAATARLTLGCLLQLASLTAFAVDRFR